MVLETFKFGESRNAVEEYNRNCEKTDFRWLEVGWHHLIPINPGVTGY